jgi:PKD repeat protein
MQFTDLSTNKTAWNWTFGDGDYSTDQNPLHIYRKIGNFTVSLNASQTYDFDIKTEVDYVGTTPCYIVTPTIQVYPFSQYSDPLGYILSDGSDNSINFYNFKNATDGKAVEIIISGSYEVV